MTDDLEKLLEDAADFSSALDWDTLAEAAKEDYVWAVNRLIHERKQAAKLLAIVRRQNEGDKSLEEIELLRSRLTEAKQLLSHARNLIVAEFPGSALAKTISDFLSTQSAEKTEEVVDFFS